MEQEAGFFDGWNFDKVLDLGFKAVDRSNAIKSNENTAADIQRKTYEAQVQANNTQFSLQSLDSNKKLMIGGVIGTVVVLALIFK